MAQLSRHSPIITTASLRHKAMLKSPGTTHVIDRSLPGVDILGEARKVAGSKSVEYVFDATSAKDTEVLAYDALTSGGGTVLVQSSSIPDDRQSDDDGKRVVSVFGSLHVPFHRALAVDLCSRLAEWLRTGMVVVSMSIFLRVIGSVTVF